MRKSSFAPGILFLVFALALPALIIAQQTDRPAGQQLPIVQRPNGAATNGKTSPTAPAIKSDLAEALSVIQSNHIDGRKLELQRRSSSRRSAAC